MSDRKGLRGFRRHRLGRVEWVFITVILAGFGFSLLISTGDGLFALFGPVFVSPAVWLGVKVASYQESRD